jgi:hypothetical protein
MDEQEHVPPPMPTESKVVATARLRAEGRWADASLYRDERRVYWRSVDQRANAAEWSWREMVAEFPPLPKPESEAKPKAGTTTTTRDPDPLDITDADPALIRRLMDVDIDWDRDVMWCYRVYAAPASAIRLEDAPSLAAWGTLRTARAEPQRFLTMAASVIAKTVKAATTERETPAPQPRETQDPGLADLQRMIDEAS